jgi:hypothetical protein
MSPGDAVSRTGQGSANGQSGWGASVLWAIAGLNLALNLSGITWGLPARWHPDEKADTVALMIEEHTLRPESFINPSLPFYLMLGPIALQKWATRLGWLQGPLADPLLAGRVLAACAGAGAVYLLGRLRPRPSPSLLPALFLALSPAVTNLCHFATPEAFLLLGTVASLKLALGHLEGRIPAWAVGLVIGLTTSTKYTAAALLIPGLAAVLLRPLRDEPNAAETRALSAPRLGSAVLGLLAIALGTFLVGGGDARIAAQLRLPDSRLLHPEHAFAFVRGIGQLALLGGALGLGIAGLSGSRSTWARRLARPDCVVLIASALLGFLLGSPYAAVEPRAFLSDLAFNSQTRFEYKGLTGEPSSYLAYWMLLGQALTGPLLGAALLGALVAAWRGLRGDARALVILLAALAPYVLVASSGHRALRFLVPVLPSAVWLAALCIAWVPSARVARFVTVVVVARAALGAALVVRLFHVDSRIEAARFLEDNVPVGSTVDLIANNPGYAPTLPAGLHLRVVPTLSREMAPSERFAEAALRYPAEASPWLVLTASYYERFLDHAAQRPEQARFFKELLAGRAGFEVVARFRQDGWRRPPAEFLDPEIVILSRRPVSGP